MPGVLNELLSITGMFAADSRTATGILYNDNATGAVGIDTRDFDEAIVQINAGTFASSATVAFDLYENTTNDAETSTAVTSGSFGSIDSTTDNSVHFGQIRCRAQKRYLFLRANKTANTDAADYSATIIMGRADKNITNQTSVTFDAGNR